MDPNSNTIFQHLARKRPRTQLVHNFSPSANRFPLLQLPSDVLDLIVYYYLPLPSSRTIQHESLAHKILPLALTCQFMFDRIAKFVAYYIQHDILLKNTIDFSNDSEGHTLMYEACIIALRNLSNQVPCDNNREYQPNSNDHHRPRMLTRSMTTARNTQFDIQSCLPVDPSHDDDKVCSPTSALFKKQSHSRDCTTAMAWHAIAASTGKVNKMKLYFYADEDDSMFESCLLRFWTALRLPLKEFYLPHKCYATSNHARILLQSFLATVSNSLTLLEMDITSASFQSAVCITQFPHLKSLIFKFEDLIAVPRSSIKKNMQKVLSSLNKNGTRLEKIWISGNWVNAGDVQEPFNLSELAPTVHHLKISNLNLDSEWDYQQLLQHCDQIKTLEQSEGYFWYAPFQTAKAQGMLPNLESLLLCDMTYVELPKSLPENENVMHRKLIKKLCVTGVEYDNDMFEALRDSFYHIPWIAIHVSYTDILNIVSFLNKANDLKFLSVSLGVQEQRDGFMGNFQENSLYSKSLMEAIISNCKGMECLRLYGCCAKTDQCIKILQNMGSNAKELRLVLVDETRGNGMMQGVPGPTDVIRVLDTIVEHCPRMEKLYILTHRSGIMWTDNAERIVNNGLKQAARKLPSFEVWSFTKDFGFPI